MVSLDIKNFDASEHELLMKLIDFSYRKMNRPLYARLGLNREQIKGFMKFAQTCRAVIEVMRTNANPKFRIRRKADLRRLLRITAKQTTFSGDPLKTTLGNTNRQLHFIYCLLLAKGLLAHAFAMASGDDMLIVIEREKLAELLTHLDSLYAREGDTGVKGSGLILKEIIVSDSYAKFLSKNVVVRVQAGIRRVYYYRQIERLLRTGEFSVKSSRRFLEEEHFNYMIHHQIADQVSGDPVLEKVLTWRLQRLKMRKPSNKQVAEFYNDAEQIRKMELHYGHHQADMYYCKHVDSSYALLAAGATPEYIMLAAAA